MVSPIQELDGFVRWDSTAHFPVPDFVSPPNDTGMPAESEIDQVLTDADDNDEFSFWGQQHFSSSLFQSTLSDKLCLDSLCITEDVTRLSSLTTKPADLCNDFAYEAHEKACGKCSLREHSCKIIQGAQEGRCEGHCPSCMAVRCDCSFGIAPDAYGQEGITLSLKPPPTIGEHPIPREDVTPTSLASSSLPEASQKQPSIFPSAEIFSFASSLETNSQPPKVSPRFSKESVKILKNWLFAHNWHPYPSEEEKVILQRQTGLNKTQVSNWLANARRRGKIQSTRSTSPHVRNTCISPIDIPRRPDTLAPKSNTYNKNPLERWVDSPPEAEPASVTAIARAVASNSDISLKLNSLNPVTFTDNDSNGSFCNVSSASSTGTSSGGSFASTHSHGSFDSMIKQRGRRRRRRRAAPKREERASFASLLNIFQCTFCTETFTTKHDWQRHEKSLHLALERWICTPNGPRVLNPQTNQICCVFCGEIEPNNAHIENHNHLACLERSLEERIFYRKDHLNQHLRLVHDAKFLDWSMTSWKIASPEIRSRCGFCGIVMASWSARVDHLAQHFKTGNTMADWKGDWGFDAPVLDMVENFIPPYLIETERRSPFPYIASGAPAETPRNAYELIKLELDHFMVNNEEKTGTLPSDRDLQLEACRIIFASELLSVQGVSAKFSWLRDIVMASDDIARQAQFGPIRQGIENRLSILKINAEDNLFEQCPLECQFHEYIQARTFLGLTTMDSDLQQEACRIVRRMEEITTTPSSYIANWLVRLITSSTSWLAKFRQRAHLPSNGDVSHFDARPTDPNVIGSTIHSYNTMEWSLREHMDAQRPNNLEPSDDDLERRVRNQHFNVVADTQPARAVAGGCSAVTPAAVAAFLGGPSGHADKQGAFFLTDANCYRRLARELTRFVSSAMSSNNPNRRVPTDAEIQHQARWILFDDDDPWNQTAADNAEWLLRFKRDAGILPQGPGLCLDTNSWNISQGGTGFAPPYVFPGRRIQRAASAIPAATNIPGRTNPAPTVATSSMINILTTSNSSPSGSDKIEIFVRDNAKPFETNQAVLDRYIETFASRYERPATVFCSRELETGLTGYVKDCIARGDGFPPDEALQLRARHIVGTQQTAADDPSLLGEFKVWVILQLGQS